MMVVTMVVTMVTMTVKRYRVNVSIIRNHCIANDEYNIS